ncbi:OB-fold nucleic acid binding domain-containing protein [Nocardia sp. CDC159]|uniref:OB-fold nucleic acid binding domain-containing protein n=1 Tax=Nocardia pulmonis TaxID=2951408 RepID=A0A9X2E572_9NOCA|nr:MULTISPECIES: OB-fold nucleic acid binding domain-containing protein [Nocardia]MCM6774362.1 OB-fold nucleic acid binding domain-containing protein [Nocardia pulmonis]MCM6787572.1 OB-fold nucleic acid binding domain-containing protein [Nocardia sp. CDC159]
MPFTGRNKAGSGIAESKAGPDSGYFRRLGRRLTADLDRLDAEELAETSEASGACQASDCRRGEEVTMLGRLRSVETCPTASTGGLEAEFFDGTDAVGLVWIGRRRIPGIEPGRRILVRGRIGERDGAKVMYNPYYELRGNL